MRYPPGMANPNELPQMVTELVDLSKAYINEEIGEPAKRLGRVAGIGIGAGLLMSIGALMLSVAAFRFVAVTLLPDNPYWSAAGYLGVAILLVGIAFGLVRAVTDDGGVEVVSTEGGSTSGEGA